MITPWNQFLSSLSLTADEEDYFNSKFIVRNFKAGDALLKAGEFCEFIGFVQSGYIKIYTKKDLEQDIQYLASTGDFITSFSSFFNHQPTNRFIEANTDAEVRIIDRKCYEQLTEAYPHLGWKVMEKTSAQLIDWLKERNYMVSQSARDRYINFIEKDQNFVNNMTLRDVASYLGIRQQSLSRIRREISQSY